MFNVLVVFIGLNILYYLGALFWQPESLEDIPLIEKDVPALVVLAERPGSHYQGKSAPGQSSCFSVGPYLSESIAQMVAGKIRDFGLHVVVRTINGLQTLNYLVYIEPQNSKEMAEKIVNDLKGFEVKDYTIVESGPYKNAIALGSFKALVKAKRHTEYIRYLGYDARYTKQNMKQQVYWLDYDEPFGMGTPVQTWSKSIDSALEVQVIPRACG